MRSQNPMAQFQISKMVKYLIIINVVVWFLFQVIFEGYIKMPFTQYFALYPGKVLFEGAVWQLVTYSFLHSIQSIGHLLFNLLTLWFIGTELENRWGSRSFLIFYLVSAVGAGLIYILGVSSYHLIFGGTSALRTPVLGASGAIYGLMMAYGILFGDRMLHFMMLFPMKAKYFVMILGGIEFLSLVSGGVMGSEVAYLAHLGGLASGYLSLKAWNAYLQHEWRKKTKKRNRNLKLVVDNTEDSKKGPKYWN